MIEMVDGPAAGRSFAVRRAPVLLRVVCGYAKGVEKWDALDQPDDYPEQHEKVFLYRKLPGTSGVVHIRGRVSSGGMNGCYQLGKYVQVTLPVDDDVLRDTAAWREWAASLVETADGWFKTKEESDAEAHVPAG